MIIVAVGADDHIIHTVAIEVTDARHATSEVVGVAEGGGEPAGSV